MRPSGYNRFELYLSSGYLVFKRLDFGMVLNAILAGLVGVMGSQAGRAQLWIQAKGILICGAATFPAALLIFFGLKKTIGIRVSPLHGKEGLDSHEHGIRGYTIVYDD